MPLSINFSEAALKTLMSPPPPAQPLQDIIMTIKHSKEVNALAMMGRDILRGCLMARSYRPPIDSKFELETDERIGDSELAKIARRSFLLERLKVDKVANDLEPGDIAQILCAYLGATFMNSFKDKRENDIHESINEFCSIVLQDDESMVIESVSQERMMEIPGMKRMSTPVKNEPQPPAPSMLSSSTRAPSETSHLFEDIRSTDSVSSGRSPPPLLYRAHYQQSYQPYYPPNPSNPLMLPPHMQPLHTPAMSPRFSSYVPGTVHTGSPASFAQPQPQYNSPPPHLPPQPSFHAQPLPSAVPSGGYPGMGIPNPPAFPSQAPPMPQVALQQTQGYISLINEMAMKHRKVITWQQTKVGQQHMPEWTMWLTIDGQLRGQGTAPTKQAAKEVASKAALLSLGWIQG